MADFFELLKIRRSIRDFQAKRVPLELVKEIINNACMAPVRVMGSPGDLSW